MLIQCLAWRNSRIVVPGQKLARDYFVYADVLEPEINRFLKLALDSVLPDQRNDDPRGRLVLLTQFESRAHIADLPVPPNLGRLRHAAARWTKLCVKLGVAGVHRKLDQIDMSLDESFKLLAARRRWSKHAAVGIHPNACATFLRVLDHFNHVRVQHGLAASRATHPRTVFTTLSRNALPEFYRKQIAIALVVELAYFRITISVRTHRTTEVARIDDGYDHHQRKLLRSRSQTVTIVCAFGGVLQHR